MSAPVDLAPRITAAQAHWFGQTAETLAEDLDHQLLGAPQAVRRGLVALLTGGPLWIEDSPGTGKTTLVEALARTVHGVVVVDSCGSDPAAEMLLLDARAAARDLEPRRLPPAAVPGSPGTRPSPLLSVLTTLGEVEDDRSGPSPEVRDRILLRTGMGRPDHAATVRLLSRAVAPGAVDPRPPSRLSRDALLDMRDLVSAVEVAPALLAYIAHLIEETHRRDELQRGVSPRAGGDLVRAVQAHAALAGRPLALPADVQSMVEPVWSHRLRLDAEAEYAGATTAAVLTSVLGAVRAPRARGRSA